MPDLSKFSREAILPANGIETAPGGGVGSDGSPDLTQTCRGLMVTTAGDVSVTFRDGTHGILPQCQVGVQYGAMITQVFATGTTATGIRCFH